MGKKESAPFFGWLSFRESEPFPKKNVEKRKQPAGLGSSHLVSAPKTSSRHAGAIGAGHGAHRRNGGVAGHGFVQLGQGHGLPLDLGVPGNVYLESPADLKEWLVKNPKIMGSLTHFLKVRRRLRVNSWNHLAEQL